MNVVWLILDSISYADTPFGDSGEETMPRFAELADDQGIVFDNARAPGPLSPSSHASILTGRYPSETGMHEAHPYFDGTSETIANALSETHETNLISSNIWLFQGLNDGFDTTTDFTRPYMLFRHASDPLLFEEQFEENENWRNNILTYLTKDGKPIKSLVNLLNYKFRNGQFLPDSFDAEGEFQYANRINKEVRSRMDSPVDQFIVANYMDAHPPYDASDEALEKFIPEIPRDQLPITVDPERHIPNDEKSYSPDTMRQLYKATMWDLDRKITPLIQELVENDTFVVVTSDHGLWDSDTAYSDNRLHVPLVIFSPDHSASRVTESVSLRSLPATTMDTLTGGTAGFNGDSLLSIKSDQTCVTEIIHRPNEVYEMTGRVDVTKSKDCTDPVQRDLVLVNGSSRIEYVDGDWRNIVGSQDEVEALKQEARSILKTELKHADASELQYDESTKERLKSLGYI